MRILKKAASLVLVAALCIPGSVTPLGTQVKADAPALPVRFVAASEGNGSSFAVDANGGLWAWGNNSVGQLGDGTTTACVTPEKIMDGVASVSASPYRSFAAAVKTDGTLWAWGSGWLGNGSWSASLPTEVMEDVKSVSLGANFVEAVKTDGSLWAWGDNDNGQLGDGTANYTTTYYAEKIMEGVASVSAGFYSAAAVKTDGSLWTWGLNNYGQLGDGKAESKTSAPVKIMNGVASVSAGENFTMAVKTDGSLWGCGYNGNRQLGDGGYAEKDLPVKVMDGVASVSAGSDYTTAVKTDDSLWTWGDNSNGQLGDGSNSYVLLTEKILTHITSVSAGNSSTLAIKQDGTVWAWGSNSSGQLGDGTTVDRHTPTYVIGGYGKNSVALYPHAQIAKVVAGGDCSFAIDPNHTLWGWGDDTYGELGDGGTAGESSPKKIMDHILSVSVNTDHVLAVKDDGSLWAWGSNYYGQLGDGTTTNELAPEKIMDHVAMVSAGGNHSLAIQDDGSLWAWGNNENGQLGDGTTTNALAPVKIMDHVVAASAGGNHSMAIRGDGSLWTWGGNSYGQLGDGTTANASTPEKIMDQVASASAGILSSAVVKTDGSLWTWGLNNYGQLGDGTQTNRPVPVKVMENVQSVSAGEYETAAVKADGTLWMWGENGEGQLGDGTTVNESSPEKIMAGVAAISANDCTLAVKADESLWAWGDNSYGTLGDGTTKNRVAPVNITLPAFLMCGPDTTDVSLPTYHDTRLELSNMPTNYDGTVQYSVEQQSADDVASVTADGQLSTDNAGTANIWITNAAGTVVYQVIALTVYPNAVVNGVDYGGDSNSDRTIHIYNGDATLDGQAFESGGIVSAEGKHTLDVTDQAGNTYSLSFTIDKTPPVITIGSYNNSPTNQDVTVTATTNEGVLNTTSHTFTQNGSFNFVATDAAGNVTTQTVTIGNIDKTPPAVTGVTSGGIYNTDRTITFDKGTATLDNQAFGNGGTASGEGIHTLVVTDSYGNQTILSFKIDKTAPVVTGVTDGANYDSAVTINFNEGTAILNGTAAYNGKTVSTDGSYTLVVTDAAGNVTTVHFIIDKLPTITGVLNNGDYNQSVLISFDKGTATLNGNSFASGDTVSNEGTYALVVTTSTGKSSVVTFIIDKTAPVVAGVNDGVSYNTDRTITFNEGTAMLNGSAFTSGATVSAEGNYTLIVTDAAGNVTTVHFTIDKTAPVVSGVNDSASYNTDKTITFNEGTANLNGGAFISGTTVGDEGDYTLIVTDAAGNVTTVHFAVDKTAPVISGVTDGASYNTDRTITFNEGTATLNGSAFTSGMVVNAEGNYTLTVTDAADNATTLHFTIDKTAPVVSGVSDGTSYNSEITITFTGGTATLNGGAFTSGAAVSAEGSYTLIVTDAAGNITTVHFAVDKTAPVISGVTDGASYNTDKTITFNEGTATLNGASFTSGTAVNAEGSYTLIVTDAAGNVTSVHFTIDKTAPVVSGVTDDASYSTDRTITFSESTAMLNSRAFTSGTTVSVEGSYTLTVTDAAGNVTTVHFTIDKTAPVVSGVTDGAIYNTDKTITFSEGKATLNGGAFTSGTTVSAEGSYTLTVIDPAGNATTVHFTIDKTPPVVTISPYNTNPTNQDITVTASSNEGTLNAASYTFTQNGDFTFTATDAAGNVTTKTVSITNIDKTPPVITIGSYNTNSTNQDITVTASSNEGMLNTDTHTFTQNGSFTFTSTDAAGNVTSKTVTITNIDKTAPEISGVADGLSYNINRAVTFNEGTAMLNGTAFVSGTTVNAEGSYTLVVTDTAGNTTIVHFTIDKTAPVVTGAAESASYNTDRTIIFNEGTATLNGSAFTSGTTVSAEGSYTLIVTDTAGNVTTIHFTIDKMAPVITIGSYNMNPTNQDITVTASTNEGTLNASSHTFTLNGSFTFTATDDAGNVTNKTVTITNIDKAPPVITIGTYNTNPTNQNITVTASTNEGTINVASHTFTQNGSFTFTATDDAGNVTNKTVAVTNIDKTAPVITIASYNTNPTNQNITVMASTNEGTINVASHTFTQNGSFTFTAIDDAGNVTNKTVTVTNIDKTSPVVTINPYNGQQITTSLTITASTSEGKLNATSHTFTQNGSFTFTAADAAGNVASRAVAVNNIVRSLPNEPLIRGCIDSPGTGTYYGGIPVAGWALTRNGVSRIDLYADNNRWVGSVPASALASRSDVQRAVNGNNFYLNENNGFSFTIPNNFFGAGKHTLKIAVIDQKGKVQWITRTFTQGDMKLCVDAPRANSSVSGGFNVSGWAVGPAGISRVDIYADVGSKQQKGLGSVSAASFTARPDVQRAVFPNGLYPTGSKCGFSLNVPAKKLSKGTHTLAIAAIGNDGKVKWAMVKITIK